MPAILTAKIQYGNYYYIDISDLIKLYPHLVKAEAFKTFIVEIRNDEGKLVKRYKPFKEQLLNKSPLFNSIEVLQIDPDIADELNLGNSYTITLIATEYRIAERGSYTFTYKMKPLLPMEIKFLDKDSQRVFEYISNVEVDFFLLSLYQPLLRDVLSVLWDANVRLFEGDVEGARTSLRNALDLLLKNIVLRIESKEESKEFQGYLEDLVKKLRKFVEYGGPHPGPAPRTSTEMVFSMTLEMLKHLTKMLEDGTIMLREHEESEASR
jgi:predicted nucleic acid-binding protein